MMNAYSRGLDFLGGQDTYSRQKRARHEFIEFIGSVIDTAALAERFDSLDGTNQTVRDLWLQPYPGYAHGHGLALAERATNAAKEILDKAIAPTNEFEIHDATLNFGKHAMALTDKVMALPSNDSPSPVWNEVKQYFINGSELVNKIEGVRDGSVKWTDVKDYVKHIADAAKGAATETASTIKWTLIGVAGVLVLAVGGVVYSYRRR